MNWRLHLLLFLFLNLVACYAPRQGDREIGSYSPSPEPVPLLVPSRTEDFIPATNQFGALVVREGEFEAQSKIKPWSSWWFPTKDTYLFQGRSGQLSPLEKYDLISQKVFGKKTKAAFFEKTKLYDPEAVGWEGLCHAWAIASLVAPEPTQSRQINGITLSVGDQKALIVKTFEEISGLKNFGQRFEGNRLSVFDDIYPDQFHKLLQITLFEQGSPFIMDKDPGVAVWNTPIYKAQMRVERDTSHSQVLHVTTWLNGASPFVDSYDYVGTLSVVFEYTYDLYGNFLEDGSFEVKYGEWTGQSLDYHPDFITLLPPDTENHQSKNKEVDSKFVEEILKRVL